MDSKKIKEAIALTIVISVSVVGFFLVYWFFQIIAMPEIKTADSKNSLRINDGILEKVTNPGNGTPLLLEDKDFGRENPFANVH